MPLANHRDQETQVLWGIEDFKFRFGRRPEGMWLPETAVNMESLEILAGKGILFTILAPHQARRVRPMQDGASGSWTDVSGGKIDPTMAYEVRLPSGNRLSLFFYDAPISRGVAFEKLLNRGEDFAHRLIGAFSNEPLHPQLVHIATDGETYGHHHRFGEMALAFAIHYIETNHLAVLTNYGEFLERHPPTHEVEIMENTSWSCTHGIERWKSDCGCNTGRGTDWSQSWRAPLRSALDWLRDTILPHFEERSRGIFRDPWDARNDYIHVILDRSPENLKAFLERNLLRPLNSPEEVVALKLMELQRHCLLMYTSCGWFFDDLSGIETIQVIQYAHRALELAEDLFHIELSEEFVRRLSEAKSNLPEFGDGRMIHDRFVKPAKIDLRKASTHYAVSSLFENYEKESRIYCYTVMADDLRLIPMGNARLSLGNARIVSEITRESDHVTFGVLHLGDQNIIGGVRPYENEESWSHLMEEMTAAFDRADLTKVIQLVDKRFGSDTYTIRFLFRDEQRKILSKILEPIFRDVESSYRRLFERYLPLMRFLSDLNYPLPREFRITAEYALNAELRETIAKFKNHLDQQRLQRILHDVRDLDIRLDDEVLKFQIEKTLTELTESLAQNPMDAKLFDRLDSVLSLTGAFPFDTNLRNIQNIYYDLLREVYPRVIGEKTMSSKDLENWVCRFQNLGHQLKIHIP